MKMIILVLINLLCYLIGGEKTITANELISAMDANLNAKSRVLTSRMIVHGRRASRTIESRIAPIVSPSNSDPSCSRPFIETFMGTNPLN